MFIDDDDRGRTLDTHARDARDGRDLGIHVLAVRPSLDPSQADGQGEAAAPEGVHELQQPAVEHAGRQGPDPQSGQAVARRDDHRRVTCSHCGRRVLTRRSGAMWAHEIDGSECPGSKSWDHEP